MGVKLQHKVQQMDVPRHYRPGLRVQRQDSTLSKFFHDLNGCMVALQTAVEYIDDPRMVELYLLRAVRYDKRTVYLWWKKNAELLKHVPYAWKLLESVYEQA